MTSITDILASDPRSFKLSSPEDVRALRAQVQQLADAANKRVRRMQKSKETSLAEIGREKSGLGMFTTKGKSGKQLIEEFKRAKEYLEAKTSTIKGAREFKKTVLAETNKRLDAQMSGKEAEVFWDVMEKVYEQTPQKTLSQQSVTSYDAQKRVYELVEGGMTDPVKIADMLTDKERTQIWNDMEEAKDLSGYLEDIGFFAT